MSVAHENSATGEKTVLSHAAQRRLRKPQTQMTAEEKEKWRDNLRALRKEMRMRKANGSRAKVRKYEAQKRQRDSDDSSDSEDRPPAKKQRREDETSRKPAPKGDARLPQNAKAPADIW